MSELNGPTEQAAYERELKRQERELSLKKQELIQRDHNDKMMLTVTTISVIVALIAVGVTLWASLDTSENSKRALDLQISQSQLRFRQCATMNARMSQLKPKILKP
jgi:hypothetical protein